MLTGCSERRSNGKKWGIISRIISQKVKGVLRRESQKNIVKKVKVKFYSQVAATADPVAMARGTRSLPNLLHIPLYPDFYLKTFFKTLSTKLLQ